MADARKKIGLALGGGGVKGLSHIGVIKVLEENKIPIDFIAGTSIGALIGAYYSAYQNVDILEKTAIETNWRTAFTLFDPAIRGGLIKGKKIEKLLEKWLSKLNFNDLKIPLTVVATDLVTGKEVDINNGDVSKAVRASLAVPPVFKPVPYKDRLLSDGGLANPLPVNLVKGMGAEIVIAINLESGKFQKDIDSSFIDENISLVRISIRALNVIRYHLAKNQAENADILIEPLTEETGLIGWNRFFDNHKTKNFIKAGETAAKKVLPQLLKLTQ